MRDLIEDRRWVLIVAGIIVLLVIILGGYWVWVQILGPDRGEGENAMIQRPVLRRMANLPPKKTEPAPPKPSYTPDAPVLEQARTALSEGITPAAAVALARSLPDRPERADAAFLLLEYAAEEGNAEAALAVAQYYDPASGEPSGTIRKNPETAYDWYKRAQNRGQENVENHLTNLKQWLEEQGKQGSREAGELLKRWQ